MNVNEANPQVLLARLCGEVPETTLCADPLEAIKFTQILSTVRMLIPIPLFTQPSDFIGFVEGKTGSKNLYGMLQGFLGEESEILFAPVELTEAQREALGRTFATAARIFTIVATGQVGHSQVRIESVVNFHTRWVPPPPNAGRMPGLGVFHYYRVN